MKKIKNNQNQVIEIDDPLYEDLKKSYEEGDFVNLIKIGENSHVILLSENFKS